MQLLDELVWTWVEFDDGSATLAPEDLFRLLQRLGLPLGLPDNATDAQVAEFAARIHIPLKRGGRMPFHQTAFELVRNNCEAHIPPCAIRDALDKQYGKFVRAGCGGNDEEDIARDAAALRRLAEAVKQSHSALSQSDAASLRRSNVSHAIHSDRCVTQVWKYRGENSCITEAARQHPMMVWAVSHSPTHVPLHADGPAGSTACISMKV